MPTELLLNGAGGVLAALIGAGVIVLGWRVAHRQEVERDSLAKRRDFRVQFLIEAYRRLEFASNRPITPALAPDFEKAIADIQLFGSPQQVTLAQEFATTFATKGTAPLDPLLSELRHDLRGELRLDPVPRTIRYLRMAFDEPARTLPPGAH